MSGQCQKCQSSRSACLTGDDDRSIVLNAVFKSRDISNKGLPCLEER